MALGKDEVIDALRGLGEGDVDVVSAGVVKKVSACDGYVRVTLERPENEQAAEHLRAGVETLLRRRAAAEGEELKDLNVAWVEPAPGGVEAGASSSDERPTVKQREDIPLKQASSSPTIKEGTASGGSGIPGVKHIIAVGAGKGGVGKSTVSVNLALALARQGHGVGLMDGDIYGPSAPTLLGLDKLDVTLHENMLQTFAVHGIKAMTIGKLVDSEKPLIWRGPMAHGAFKQLVEQTSWGELDYLIIDLPPGTGDVPLSMSQMLSLTGAVIVCTPQKVAQDDAVRAARMFQQLNVDVLGVVENMSFFIGDDGKEYDIFGRGGAEMMAQRMGLPYLGAIPITMALRANSDAGNPSANFEDDNAELRSALERFAQNVVNEAAMAGLRRGGATPSLSVS
jgi:ATP-binding protein involved in chromosome partitioning